MGFSAKEWLEDLGLDEVVVARFLEEGYDCPAVLAFTEKGDLEALGVVKLGTQKKFLLAAQQLKTQISPYKSKQKRKSKKTTAKGFESLNTSMKKKRKEKWK